jgi:hypothetical protein
MSQSSQKSSSGSSRDLTGQEPGRESDRERLESKSDRSPSSGGPLPEMPFDPSQWFPGFGRTAPSRLGQEPDLDDVLRCREQAIYAAAMLAPDMSVFNDEDELIADRTVAVARRFEQYILTGQ